MRLTTTFLSSVPKPTSNRHSATSASRIAVLLVGVGAGLVLPPSAGAQTVRASLYRTPSSYAALPAMPSRGRLPEAALRALSVAAGYVASPEALVDDGMIVTSATEGDVEERSLSVFDVVYVEPAFDGRSAVAGDSLLIYVEGGDLRRPDEDDSFGTIVRPTGVAMVTEVGREVASAVIVEAFSPVQTGQRVQYQRSPAGTLPAGELQFGEGAVVGLREHSAIVGPFAVLYLDLPTGSGLAAGADVRLVRPAFKKGRELPEIQIGWAHVLDVGGTAATAIVTELARSDLRVGDRYRLAEMQP